MRVPLTSNKEPANLLVRSSASSRGSPKRSVTSSISIMAAALLHAIMKGALEQMGSAIIRGLQVPQCAVCISAKLVA